MTSLNRGATEKCLPFVRSCLGLDYVTVNQGQEPSEKDFDHYYHRWEEHILASLLIIIEKLAICEIVCMKEDPSKCVTQPSDAEKMQ